jgi:hypothetical protein
VPTKDADEHIAEICRRLEAASPDDFTLVSPANLMGSITGRTNGVREQIVR